MSTLLSMVYPPWFVRLFALSIACLLSACSPASPPEPNTPAPAAEQEPEPGSAEPAGAPSGDDAWGEPRASEPMPSSTPQPPGQAGGAPAADARSNGAEASEGMISFFEIGRGDRVADLGGLFGYSLEPILDAVGGSGVVYARLRPGLAPDAVPYAQPDRARQGELVWMKTPLSAPFSAEAKQLNAVTLLYAYHSLVAAGQDRKEFNASVFRALVPGGTYIIVDHAAPPGSGLAAAAQQSRIEDRIVRAEVEAAGFAFIAAADFVLDAPRPPDQPPPSQYVLKFKKPK